MTNFLKIRNVDRMVFLSDHGHVVATEKVRNMQTFKISIHNASEGQNRYRGQSTTHAGQD